MERKAIDTADYRGVWVFAEQIGGKPTRVSLELLGKGRELADKLEVQLTAVLLGERVQGLAELLIAYGADVVLVADDPVLAEYRTETYTDIIAEQVIKRRPEVFIIGATPIGRDLAPRLSCRLITGCTADCTGIDIDMENRLVISHLPAYGGNVMATIVCPEHRPQISTVRPGVMLLPEENHDRSGDIVRLDVQINPKEVKVKIIESIKMESDGVRIEEAERIVGVGRGVGGEVMLERVNELAKLIGAEVGATQFAVDAGWLTQDRLIGQTGKVVRPELYIACGISGAVQHTAGMSDAKIVFAINKDPKAEIFKHSDYGMVGDIEKIVPAMVEALKQLLEVGSANA